MESKDMPTKPIEIKEEAKEQELIVDPYSIVNKTGKEIDYDILIKKFGCSPITPELLEKIAHLT